MASKRATSHYTYDKYFRPILAALREREAQGLPPRIAATFKRSQAIETRARYYVWRKLLREFIARNALSAAAEDVEDCEYANQIAPRITNDNGTEATIEFFLDRGTEFLAAFGIAESSAGAEAGLAPQSLVPPPKRTAEQNNADILAAIRAASAASTASTEGGALFGPEGALAPRTNTPQPPAEAWDAAEAAQHK